MSRKLGLPPAATQYGASMGRDSVPLGSFDQSVPVRLRRVRLDAGGYDEGGAYWGHHITATLTARIVHLLYRIDGKGAFEAEVCGYIRVPVPCWANARSVAVSYCKAKGFTVKGRQS